MLKVTPYDRIPYLFGRLKEAGVKRRIIEQFRCAPAAAHDDVTLNIMGVDGRLKADFDALNEDGTGMTVSLAAEVFHIGKT